MNTGSTSTNSSSPVAALGVETLRPHVMLHEAPRERLDREFLLRHSSAPYLVGAHGFYLREPATGAPIVAGALEARETHVALEIGADGEVLGEGRLEGETQHCLFALIAYLN